MQKIFLIYRKYL